MHRESIEAKVVGDLKISAISPTAGTLEHLRSVLQAWDSSLRLALVTGGLEQVGPVAERDAPDLLIVEGARNDEEELHALERVIGRCPDVPVVLLSPNQSPGFLRHAMRIGLREVLPAPVPKEQLLDTIGSIQQRIALARMPKRTARTFCLVGCKGGSGVTFLAANLGYALAQQDPSKRVALIDLNSQFGDVALYVSDATPPANLSDVTRQVHRLDGALLASSMLHVLPNFHVLAAPEDPEQALHIRPEQIDALLWVAASHYDVVIVDLGRSLDSISVRAMDAAELIFPVLQTSVPYIRDAQRLLRALDALGYGGAKLRLLANRVEKRGMVTLKDVSSTLRQSIFHAVPNGYTGVAASINAGVPLMKREPRNPVSRSVRELARELVAVPRERSGWMRSLLQRS